MKAANDPRLIFGEGGSNPGRALECGRPEVEWTPIDSGLHAPINQAVAVVKRSGRPELGVALIQFVNGREGREIMKRHGFLLPGEF